MAAARADTDASESSDPPSPRAKGDEELRGNPFFAWPDGHEHAQGQKRRGLPPLLQHLTKPKDLKVWFKCSVAAWVAFLFLLIGPTLDNYGQATFFGPIIIFMNPPSGIVFIAILGGITGVVGMCLAWAWGVITMKAALATRSVAETTALLGRLAAQAGAIQTNTAQTTGQSSYIQILIFQGFALDTRVVVTYFFMLGLFIYLVARIRVAAPKLILLQVFSVIVADIFLTIGPLLPTFTGTLPQVLVKPAVTGVAIATACNLLFFPESTSHQVLEGMETCVAPMKGFVESCLKSFEHHPIRFDEGKLQATKGAVTGSFQALQGSLGFLPMDWSRCRWNVEDVVSIRDPLRELVVMFLGLLNLQLSRTQAKGKIERMRKIREMLGKEKLDGDEKLPAVGHHQIYHAFALMDRFPQSEAEGLMSQSMQALAQSSRGILLSSADALDAIVEAVHETNERRWFRNMSFEAWGGLRDKHQRTLDQLREQKLAFAKLNTEHLLDPHLHLFDENGKLKKLNDDSPAGPSHNIHGLVLALIFEEKLLSLADAAEALLKHIIALETKRTTTRIWAPTGLRHFVAWGLGRSNTPSVASSGGDDETDLDNPDKAKKQKKRRSKKDRKGDGAEDASAQDMLDELRVYGGKQRGGLGRFLIAAADWLTDTEGLYALRVLIATVALALPAVISHSAGFFYRERGLWALIMAQTGLVTFTADFVFGLISRVAGTLVGGVVGMLCWYIGAGSGPGNPYGMAAVVAVAVAAAMYLRLFAPPTALQGVLLGVSTFALVVGYSWDDTHIPSYGNPGVGYAVFWRRTLLVLIGFSVSAIVLCFPRPPSATRSVAAALAANLRAAKDLYALLLASWPAPPPDLGPVAQRTALAVAEALAPLPARIALLRFDVTRSPLDAATLSRVAALAGALAHNLSQLFTYAVALPPPLRARFARLSGATDERLVGDLMAVLSLVEQSLKTGDPLPAVLPVPVLARAFEYGAAGLEDVVSVDLVRSQDFRKYCVAVNAFVTFLATVDELVLVVKATVGEEHGVLAWEHGEWKKDA